MNNKLKVGLGATGLLIAVLSIIGLAFAYVALPALVVWLLWNHAVAAMFHGPHFSFWQVFVALWLLSIVLNFLKPSK